MITFSNLILSQGVQWKCELLGYKLKPSNKPFSLNLLHLQSPAVSLQPKHISLIFRIGIHPLLLQQFNAGDLPGTISNSQGQDGIIDVLPGVDMAPVAD